MTKLIEYIDLKNSYISAIQAGLMMNADYEEAKRGNDILHHFCEKCIDNSNYSELDKQSIKHDLKLVKEALSQEIEHHFRKTLQ